MTQATAPSTLTFEVTRRADVLPDAEREAILANPGFGKKFTDHMVLATWTAGEGWHDGRVTAYGPISLDPSAAVLHYAQEIFEGMKAYRHADGSIWTFRPEANAARFARSGRRLLHGWGQACLDLAVERLHARGPGWHRRRQVRWQLRREPGRAGRGQCQRL